jgi:ubiquinone/menaquinone biosynthesis C-methylase UbiE
MQRLRDTKTELVAGIISDNVAIKPTRILVVGCGTGVEAAILARKLETDVIGIDVEDNFDPESARQAELKIEDAMSLSFEDNSFDFVYSYHALEHIPDPVLALAEMKRVLNDGGGYWIGTPNRLRIIGYLGSKTATPGQKIKWNLIDWKAKLAGRFRNELGAHAGYSPSELSSMLENVFSNTKDVTNTYYHVLYGRHIKVLRLLELSGLSTFLYPSVYFMGNK